MQEDLADWDRKYIWHPFTQMQDYISEEPLIIESGQGCYLIDIRGRRYLDGVSSLWVNVHGHSRPELNKAIQAQLKRVAHSTLLGLGNVPSIRLARRLVDITPEGLEKVFYSDDGATAVEVGLKITFQYWQQKNPESKKNKKKTKFISFKRGYHGDTLGAVSLGGIDLFHNIYRPLLFENLTAEYPYCYRCYLKKEYPACGLACIQSVKQIIEKNHEQVAGLIIEPLIQGAGGMITSAPGFLKQVRQLCSQYNIIMIADEVATGFGRTGKMFACQHENVSPDIICLAKGITAGYLPLAATLTTNNIFEAFCGDYSQKKTFFHGHTYTGNPLACAVALASLEIFEKDRVLERLVSKIELFRKHLAPFEKLEHVGQVRQCGLMVGIELVRDKVSKEEYPYEEKIGIKVIMEARKRGLVIRPLGNVIVLMPALSITSQELKALAEITYESVKTITNG